MKNKILLFIFMLLALMRQWVQLSMLSMDKLYDF